MFKYEMIIDTNPYVALFVDHFEAADFIADNEADGSVVIVNKYTEISANEILADESLEYAYRIEMASALLLDGHFEKWTEQENALKRLGYLA